MSIIFKVIILSFATLISLFIVWSKLRDDYQDNEIFPLSLGIIFGVLLGFFLGSGFVGLIGDIRFWTSLFTGLFLGIFLAKRLSIRFFEVLEAVVPATLVYLFFVSLTNINFSHISFSSFSSLSSLRELIDFVPIFSAIFIFLYVSTRYRRFLWYPSGKLGLGSLTSVFVFFLTRVALANFAPSMLTWSGVVLETIFGIACMGLILVVAYIRSGRNFNRDFGFLAKRKR